MQICMGAPSIWTELGDLMGDEEWKWMVADLGRTYFTPKEERGDERNELLGKREFTYPFMATGIGAYGAAYLKDEVLAKCVWKVLLGSIMTGSNQAGFAHTWVPNAGNQENLREIPWVSTNFVAQFGLNVIMVLEFIREYLPKTMEDAAALLGDEEKHLHMA